MKRVTCWDCRKIPYANILHTSELHQFQFVTAYKFVHHDQKNYETKERTVNHVYFSAHSKFWALETGLSSTDGALNLCACSIFLAPRRSLEISTVNNLRRREREFASACPKQRAQKARNNACVYYDWVCIVSCTCYDTYQRYIRCVTSCFCDPWPHHPMRSWSKLCRIPLTYYT